jgi:hypothetical protein
VKHLPIFREEGEEDGRGALSKGGWSEGAESRKYIKTFLRGDWNG